MRIKVNGEAIEVLEKTSISELLKTLSYQQTGLAVAVNRQFVSKSDYGAYYLSADDEVDIVAPFQGG